MTCVGNKSFPCKSKSSRKSFPCKSKSSHKSFPCKSKSSRKSFLCKSKSSHMTRVNTSGMYLSKGPSVLDNSKIRSLILSLSITVSLARRHSSVGRWFPPGTPDSSTRKLISSSPFHRMTLAAAEALNPNKPNQTREDPGQRR